MPTLPADRSANNTATEHLSDHNALADFFNDHPADPAAHSGTYVAASHLPINVREAPFNAVGDGVADDTAAIQAAIDAGDGDLGGVTVYLPRGQYLISQLKVHGGVTLVGDGAGVGSNLGTQLIQKDDVDSSAIVIDTEQLAATDYLHFLTLRSFRLEKISGATDTAGSGIAIACRTGEGFVIEHVAVHRFPEHGISLTRGGTTPLLTDLHLFHNGSYGLNIERTVADTWQVVRASMISGDDNGTALIRINRAGSTEECFYLSDIKAETATVGEQPYAVELVNMNTSHVLIDNISFVGTGGSTGTALVHNLTNSCRVLLRGYRAASVTNVVHDEAAGTTFSTFGDLEMLWSSGVAVWRHGILASAATFGDGANIVLGTTTGTKLGTAATQKLGFFNTTPVVQPTAVGNASDAATVITQLNALLTRMRTLGLIAT